MESERPARQPQRRAKAKPDEDGDGIVASSHCQEESAEESDSSSEAKPTKDKEALRQEAK